MTVYLLVLKGQGDTHAKLVPQHIWDWIRRSDTPGRVGDESGWIDTATPESIVTALAKEDSEPFVTIGSYENDRALLASGDEVLFDEYGDHDAPDNARDWAEANGHVIAVKWNGFIY